MRYALLTAYDGTDYGGWQIQPNAVTVQQRMTEALSAAFGGGIKVVASGRTDAGVHARGQVCHFDADITVPADRVADALNCRLPRDIRVLKSVAAPDGFDAHGSVRSKTYCYRLYVSHCSDPFRDRYSVWMRRDADEELLKRVCGMFVGEHDFRAFCASGSQVKTTVRTVYSAEVRKTENGEGADISLYFTGSGFLYNMVRTLTGTALEYACGKLDEAAIEYALRSGDRNAVGKTMPARGLTLENVDYGFKLF